jgi:glyoxylase-like metal-dependent hydrolase (beta-lactamase superfamily II)
MICRKIALDIYQFSGPLGDGIWGVNIFLLAGDCPTLIDAGFKGRAKELLKNIARLGFSPRDIKNIIVTHHHADHIGNLAELKETTRATIIAHPADASYIDGKLPQPEPKVSSWVKKALSPLHHLWETAPVAIDRLVNDGDELAFNGGIKVLHAPGHTPGSICLLVKSQGLLIAGDVLNRRLHLKLPAKMFTADPAQEIISVEKIARADFDSICFGHGAPIIGSAHSAVAHFLDRISTSAKQAGYL